jgi:hypothetical protein
VRTPVEQQEELVAEFRRSGLSAMQFAGLVGVRYSTFWTWVNNRREAAPQTKRKAAQKQRFVEVVVAEAERKPARQGAPLHVVLPGGATLSLVHGQQVALAAALIKALATPC